MSGKLDQLKEILGEVSDVYHAASVLEWDQQVLSLIHISEPTRPY